MIKQQLFLLINNSFITSSISTHNRISTNSIVNDLKTNPNIQNSDLTASFANTCIIHPKNRKLLCQGWNMQNQLEIPKRFLKNTESASPGMGHICAINNNIQKENLECWGSNDQGQLIYPPVLFRGVLQVESADFHSCALTLNRDVYCWGMENDPRPEQDRRLIHPDYGQNANVQNIVVGGMNTCVFRAEDDFRCFGINHFGQTDIPLNVQKIPIRELSIGIAHMCALPLSSLIKPVCWGDDNLKQLQNPGNKMLYRPLLQSLVAGGKHTCSVDQIGRVECWGAQQQGAREIPDVMRQGVVHITSGAKHICGLNSNGRIICWGDNQYGQCVNV